MSEPDAFELLTLMERWEDAEHGNRQREFDAVVAFLVRVVAAERERWAARFEAEGATYGRVADDRRADQPDLAAHNDWLRRICEQHAAALRGGT
jgi:hypothetical protein